MLLESLVKATVELQGFRVVFRVRDGHPAELIPPEVVTGLREPVPAAQVLHRKARFGLPQEPDDLRLAESFLHVRSPFS